MATITKKGLKDTAQRIKAFNFKKVDLLTLADHKTSIEVKLPYWLDPRNLTEDGPDKKAFDKKLRDTLLKHATKKGYTIQMMDKRMPEPAHDIMRDLLKYTFHTLIDNRLEPVR